jgi:undecaprenyl-diphosphatase
VTYVVAALLGILQGLTEFLPVSSTAHLLIAERVFGFEDPGGVFTVMIQLGSILAIMWLYRGQLLSVLTGLGRDPEARRFAAMIVVAFLPAAVIGGLFGDYVQTVIYENSLPVIGTTFILGGIIMLVVERWRSKPVIVDAEKTPLSRAFGIGVCQTFALVPGVSRSGATIVGGMAMGLDRPAAAEFSFFLAMPTMAAAFAKNLLEVRGQLGAERGMEIAVGFVMAFIASLIVVRPFLGVVRRAGFEPFAWYRIAAGVVLLAAIAAGWLR